MSCVQNRAADEGVDDGAVGMGGNGVGTAPRRVSCFRVPPPPPCSLYPPVPKSPCPDYDVPFIGVPIVLFVVNVVVDLGPKVACQLLQNRWKQEK